LAEYADIQRIDAQAFDPEWQKSSHDVRELTSGDGLSLIGVVDNVPVAYAIANWHDSHTTFHLVRIAVLPAYQGRRIASQLLNAVLEHGFVQGAARVTLNTQRNNYAALALYTRAGFTATGEQYEVIRAPCHGVSE
jgi:ribosomal protein S18 acetylase RimI-like enzyme